MFQRSLVLFLTGLLTLSAAELAPQDRARLTVLRHSGNKHAQLLLAAREGRTGSVAGAVERAGGKVLLRDDEVSYVYAEVPIDVALSITASADVEAANVEGSPAYEAADDGLAPVGDPARYERLVREAAVDSPLAPIRDMGIPAFWKNHPTFDGRGTGIAILEGLLDFTLPEFKSALTLDGKQVPKLIGYHDAEQDTASTPSRVPMNSEVEARAGAFTWEDKMYRVARDGRYRLGFLDERKITYFDRDLNRDGNPEGSSGLIAVLWDEAANKVWVDSDQDCDLREEIEQGDWRSGPDPAWFGKRDDQNERIGFIVRTNPEPKWVHFGWLDSRHTNMVAAVAAGRELFGTPLSGSAPAARLLGVRFPSSMHGPIAAALYAAQRPEVDVVTTQHISIQALNDGHSVPAIMMDRIARRFGKLLFESAGNQGPMLNSVAERTAGRSVISVGISQGKETARQILGQEFSSEFHVGRVSVGGPSESGLVKPDLLAPSLGLTIFPRVFQDRAGTPFRFPRGMSLSGGTSAASPYAAGAAAVLISAAKQSGLRPGMETLRWALLNSASFIPDIPANRQGRGLLNVPRAWDYLQSGVEPIQLRVEAPVKTVLSHLLETPHRGQGLYEREGWTAGDKATRHISVERLNGPPTTVEFELRIAGDASSFKVPNRLALPLRQAVRIPVEISTSRNGLHSALLQVVDSRDRRVIESIGLNVVAAGRANAGLYSETAEILLPHTRSLYVEVPKGTAAMQVEVSGAPEPLQVRLGEPTGEETRFTNRLAGTRPTVPDPRRGERQTVPDPMPGVWQVLVQGDDMYRRSEARVPFTLRVRLLSADGGRKGNAVVVSSPRDETSTVRLLSGQRTSGSFAIGLAAFVELNVKPDAKALVVRATRPRTGRWSLTLLNCVKDPCRIVTFRPLAGNQEDITVDQPEAGRWVAAIDRYGNDRAPIRYETLVAYSEKRLPQIEECLARSSRCTTTEAPAGGLVQVLSGKAKLIEYDIDLKTIQPVFKGEKPIVLGSIW